MIADVTEDDVDALYNVHFKGVLFLTQTLLPLLADGGAIVNLSSGLARFTSPQRAAYGSLKAAVESLTRYMAVELGPRGITANVIAPGPVATDFSDGFIRDNAAVSEHIDLAHPARPDRGRRRHRPRDRGAAAPREPLGHRPADRGLRRHPFVGVRPPPVERDRVNFERSDENAERWRRRFEGPMLLVAALVIPTLLLDQPNVHGVWHTVGGVLNWFTWSAFVVELVVMLRVSPSRWAYIKRNPIDAIVVVLTAPFLTALFQGARLIRLFRVTRLMRLEPLVTWMFREGGLRYAGAFAGLVVLASAEAFSVSENKSYFDGLYWAVTTVTTVGYGDELPTTPEAKAMAMLVMVVGIGFFAALAGSLADAFIQGRVDEAMEAHSDDDVLDRLDAIAAQLEEVRAELRAREADRAP